MFQQAHGKASKPQVTRRFVRHSTSFAELFKPQTSTKPEPLSSHGPLAWRHAFELALQAAAAAFASGASQKTFSQAVTPYGATTENNATTQTFLPFRKSGVALVTHSLPIARQVDCRIERNKAKP